MGVRFQATRATDLSAAVLSATHCARDIAQEKGLLQQHDEGILQEAVRHVIEANPKVVTDYKAGKLAALQYLVGQAMKETKGAGNPGVLRTLFEKELA